MQREGRKPRLTNAHDGSATSGNNDAEHAVTPSPSSTRVDASSDCRGGEQRQRKVNKGEQRGDALLDATAKLMKNGSETRDDTSERQRREVTSPMICRGERRSGQLHRARDCQSQEPGILTI